MDPSSRKSSPTTDAAAPLRKLSLKWALIVLVMSAGHLLDGYLDGVTAGSSRVVVDVLLNWVVPVGVSALGIHLTTTLVAARRAEATHAADPR